MNKSRNFMNKAIVGAGLVGALYLGGCKDSNSTQDGFLTIDVDTTIAASPVKTGSIQLEPAKINWTNARLIGKDEGFVNYQDGALENKAGYGYVYGEYLFRSPTGEEVSLFGKEEALYVGQNYDISFYRLAPKQNITRGEILKALENRNHTINYDTRASKDLEGVLVDYTRIKKPIGVNDE